MRHCIKLLFTILLVTISICQAQAKGKKDKTIYAFAYGTCFNDSTVYLSSIDRLTNAEIDSKTNFLTNRDNLANTLKTYLDNKYKEPHTCTLFYATKRDALEKKYVKIRHNTAKDKHLRLVEIPVTDFKLAQANTEQ